MSQLQLHVNMAPVVYMYSNTKPQVILTVCMFQLAIQPPIIGRRKYWLRVAVVPLCAKTVSVLENFHCVDNGSVTRMHSCRNIYSDPSASEQVVRATSGISEPDIHVCINTL